MDFPNCAKEALPRIESFINSRGKQNYAMQLISDFIFLERPKDIEVRKGAPPQTMLVSAMNGFQEFQLILVLIEYFSQPGPDASRNAIFLSLFGTNLTPQRKKVLCRLISTSISGSVAPVLSSAGTWMQQVGCTTAPCLEIAQSLVNDFIIFSKNPPEQFKQLPLVAPHFAANLMTAVADIFLNEQHGTLTLPPDNLLDVFTEWVSEDKTLCFASQQPLSLPPGAIAMPVVTPLAGLIRWTVLSPLLSNRQRYSTMHLSLLKNLLEIENKGPPIALNAQHLAMIVAPLQTYCSRLVAENMNPSTDVPYNRCMERFAQAIQVSLTAKCVFGNIPHLLCALESLPSNPFMKTVIDNNKINV